MRDIFLEASPRLELGVRILQTLALPLGYDAVSYIGDADTLCGAGDGVAACAATLRCEPASRVCDFIALHFVKRIPSIDFSTHKIFYSYRPALCGAGDGIRTRDFHLGKLTLYH